jgi:hypothetical protein
VVTLCAEESSFAIIVHFWTEEIQCGGHTVALLAATSVYDFRTEWHGINPRGADRTLLEHWQMLHTIAPPICI